MQDGVKHMRMKFYIEGPIRRGTVNLEVYKVSFELFHWKAYLQGFLLSV